jgi:hypothetical protein
MRLPRVRFTVQQMMVAVMILAGALALPLEARRRSERFQRRARYHEQAFVYLIEEEAGGPIECATGLTPSDIEEIYRDRGREAWLALNAARYHERLSEKYDDAAKRPWLPVPPDPPPPPKSYPEFEFDPELLTASEMEDAGLVLK